MKRVQIVFLMLLTLSLVLWSCGGGEKQTADNSATESSITNKDVTTPAEDGGYGFENLAEDLGYQTYVIPPEEEIYFGDPRAKKGGTFRHITTRFPATMRTEGQNANYVENSTISGLCYEGLITTHPLTLEFMPSLASHWRGAYNSI